MTGTAPGRSGEGDAGLRPPPTPRSDAPGDAEGAALVSAHPLDRPIRVVLFCGPVLETGTVRFARLLDLHPDIELVGCFCQSPGLDWRTRASDLLRRRGALALPIAASGAVGSALRWVRSPRGELRRRRALTAFRRSLRVVTDIHAPSVLDAVRELAPDLGALYGGPILRPELFRIPRLGTLGIHHGRFPDYRGKKTTFWALHDGQVEAGVTIQRVNEGVDTGEVVRSAAVPAGGRSYRRVWREAEEVGLGLYVDAILGVRTGTERVSPSRGKAGKAYRDPGPADLLRYWRRRRTRRRRRPPRRDGVLLLTESYHPMVGGGETQARALAAELARSGRPVTVLTRRWDPEAPAHARVDGNRVVRVGPAGTGHLKKWGLALTVVPEILAHRRTHPHLVVCGFRVLGIPAVALGRRIGGRVVLKGDSPGEMSGAFFGPGLSRFGLSPRSLPVRSFLALRNRLLRRADAFVAISSPLAEELRAHGVPEERIHRIPNGIDLERFRPPNPGEGEALRRELGLPPEGPLVLYTGRLVSYKGLSDLLDAWASVAARHGHAHLILVGSGGADIHDCEEELRGRVRKEGLGGRVRFAGEVSDVVPWLRAADVFAFPSRHEAFGLSVVEAMACGLPVATTTAGGLADVVSPGAGAVPVPPDDAEALAEALDRLLSDPGERERLGRAARAAAEERYGIEAVARSYLRLLAPAAARRPTRALTGAAP
jgi:glycosyltransferase involved in cell wall biosynthesis